MVTQLDSSLGLMTFGQGFHRFLHVLAVEQDVQGVLQRHIALDFVDQLQCKGEMGLDLAFEKSFVVLLP